jgi:tol-pal system protein YbgF
MRLITLRYAPVLAAAVLIGGCAVTPPDEDPVQVRLNDLDTRLARIERVVSNQSLVELAQRLESLQSDVRSLRGQLEELQNGHEGVRKQQRDLYGDLDRRIATLEAGGHGAPAGAAPGASGAANAGAAPTSSGAPATTTESAAYAAAFDALRAANYPVAISGFKSFMATYPSSELASNAQYWLGEAYYVTRDFDNAALAFQRVVREWPGSRKAPDALVKLGFTQVELKRTAAAKATLSQVVSQYPGTDAAKLAEERLRKLASP